jgi:membrane dipeptidase
MRRLLFSIFVSTVAAATLFSLHFPAASSADDIAARAAALQKRAIVLDTHDDTPQRFIYEKGFDLGVRHTDGHIDIPRMREGGMNAIFFSIWIPSEVIGPEAVKRSLRLIDSVREQVRTHPADLMLATTADEVRRAHAQGKIAALMGMEGGHMIDNDLGVLRIYAALGVRYLTLTHFKNNDWADSSTDKAVHNGLNDFGKSVVRELNRLGVMVDISHVADKTFYDALELSQAPMIASHSSCRAICSHARNMTDDMIRALAAKGGVIHINYHIGFLSEEFLKADRALGNEVQNLGKQEDVLKKCGDDQACDVKESERLDNAKIAAGKAPAVDWEKIVDHIDHVVKLVGPDHVGLGSDFDGATMPKGMEDVTHLPRITEALLRRGYSEKDVEKILGGNTLRVMAEVEAVAKKMRGEK